MIRFIEGGLVEVQIREDSEASFKKQCEIAKLAAELLARARSNGVILNISQKALEPLAMGNHIDVVTVYASRKLAWKGEA